MLPNYNHARYLPAALDALLAQSRPPDQVIVVDDGSTDESVAIAEKYASLHGSVTLLKSGHNGAVPALVRGLEAARGSYVYLAAADDLVMPGFFALGLSRLEQYPAAGLFCGTTMLYDGSTGQPAGRRPIAWPRFRPGLVGPERAQKLLRRSDNWILTGASLLLREAIEQAGGLEVSLGSFADGYMVRKVALLRGFYFEPRPVAIWNIHADSVSRKTATVPGLAVEGLESYTRRIKQDATFPTWYAEVFGRRWRFAAARIALELPGSGAEVLPVMAVKSRLDLGVLMGLRPRLGPRIGGFVALSWLYLRFRPTSLFRIIVSSMVARLTARRSAAGPAALGREPRDLQPKAAAG